MFSKVADKSLALPWTEKSTAGNTCSSIPRLTAYKGQEYIVVICTQKQEYTFDICVQEQE
jgi:hypothetical protein